VTISVPAATPVPVAARARLRRTEDRKDKAVRTTADESDGDLVDLVPDGVPDA
jgi:hypothetical protein